MNGYVDFHSRVLPKLDVENMDEELDRCVDILKILHKAKIKTVVATPYFNSVDSNVPKFLAEREEAFAKLNEKIKGMSLPRIIPGAEVLFTTSLLDIDTTKLCVGNTNYIMLSLPYQEYSDMVIETLQKLIISKNLCPIIAHIEKYYPEFYTMEQLEKISQLGVIMQLSCDAMINRTTRKAALELLSKNVVQIIGSNDTTKQNVHRTALETAMDVLNKDVSSYAAIDVLQKDLRDIHVADFKAGANEAISPSPQYADAIRIMRYHLPLGKYKQIKNNAGMIISNANIKDIMC